MTMEETIDAVPRSLVNLRDAGAASRLLRRRVLFRSDAPLSADDPPGVEPWPPPTTIDLREDAEKTEPHPYRAVSRIVDLPVLGGGLDPQVLAGAGIGSLYGSMLSGPVAGRLVAAVREIATSHGPVLVHCTAGKDRTGVTVAAALRLVGVGHSDIAADYALTTAAMPGVWARMSRSVQQLPGGASLSALPPDARAAPVHAIGAFLDALDGHDGGVQGWFLAHGGGDATLDALREHLLA